MTAAGRSLTLADASVGSIMTRKVKTIEAQRPLIECIQLMKASNIGSAVVTRNKLPVGIFTERDLVKRMAEAVESLGMAMSQVMSRPLITISPTATVWDALTLMGRNDIRRLPVMSDKELVGIVTERDIFHLIITQQSLLLESVAESMPASFDEKLKDISGTLGLVKPPSRTQSKS